jgi:hypothetical protein
MENYIVLSVCARRGEAGQLPDGCPTFALEDVKRLLAEVILRDAGSLNPGVQSRRDGVK